MNLQRTAARRVMSVVSVMAMAMAFTVATGTAAQAAAAASCVHTSVDKGFVYHTVTVKNTCSTTKRVKVVWSKAPDDSCRTLARGKSYKDKSATGTFDGLKSC